MDQGDLHAQDDTMDLSAQGMRRVWRTARAGDLNRLRLAQEPVDRAPERVRVQTQAVGLNFADIFALLGLYSATPSGTFIPGLEFSGVVTAAPEAAGVNVGERVFGVTRFGGYASEIEVQPQYCRPLPKAWTFEQGAAFPVQTLTAWYAVRTLGDLRPGMSVLVHSAAGGVGLRCLEICRRIGARVVGTVGSEGKRSFLVSRGFHDVVVRDRQLEERLREVLDGQTFDIALDAIGGRVQSLSYDLLAPAGRLIVFGAAEFMPKGRRVNPLSTAVRYLRRPRIDPLSMISENKSVMAFNLIWLWDDVDRMARLLDEITEAQLDPPHVGSVFPFEEAPEAVRHLKSGESVGKVILRL